MASNVSSSRRAGRPARLSASLAPILKMMTTTPGCARRWACAHLARQAAGERPRPGSTRRAPGQARAASSPGAARRLACSATRRTTAGRAACRRARPAPCSRTRTPTSGTARRWGVGRPASPRSPRMSKSRRGCQPTAARPGPTATRQSAAPSPRCSAMRRILAGRPACEDARPARTRTTPPGATGTARTWASALHALGAPPRCTASP
mmetsp:Transcript_80356/g.181327  ORF Transcript_80356/g.181327 Transcript_80356/m.181327 type:complete len:208 (+) Transcript_80356:554-1177(+)